MKKVFTKADPVAKVANIKKNNKQRFITWAQFQADLLVENKKLYKYPKDTYELPNVTIINTFIAKLLLTN